MEEEAEKYCLNCRRKIPAGNFEIHTIHCKRNIQLCTKCQEPVPHSVLGEHNTEYHTPVECPECYQNLENSELEEHKANKCLKRARLCQYCELELKADVLQTHEDYCGSRTEACDNCGKLVIKKYQQLHLDSNHVQTKPDEIDDSSSDDDICTVNSGLNFCSNFRNRNGYEHAYHDLDGVFQNMELRNATARMNEQIRRNAGVRVPQFENFPQLQSDAQPSVNHNWQNQTYLPCEFCDIPVIADELVLHQTGCRSDFTSYNSSARSQPVRNPDVDSVPQLDHPGDDDDNIMIPCEFCMKPFLLNFLGGHQMNCRHRAAAARTTITPRRYHGSDEDF